MCQFFVLFPYFSQSSKTYKIMIFNFHLLFYFQQIARNLLPAPQLEDMSAAKMILPQTETQRIFSEIISSGMYSCIRALFQHEYFCSGFVTLSVSCRYLFLQYCRFLA